MKRTLEVVRVLCPAPNYREHVYPYGMARQSDDRDAAQDIARELPSVAASVGALLEQAHQHLSVPEYDSLVYRLESAHAVMEASKAQRGTKLEPRRS
jgi:hypothetical protein